MLETITMIKEAKNGDLNGDKTDVLSITYMTIGAPTERQLLSINYADLTVGEKTTIDALKVIINNYLNKSL